VIDLYTPYTRHGSTGGACTAARPVAERAKADTYAVFARRVYVYTRFFAKRTHARREKARTHAKADTYADLSRRVYICLRVYTHAARRGVYTLHILSILSFLSFCRCFVSMLVCKLGKSCVPFAHVCNLCITPYRGMAQCTHWRGVHIRFSILSILIFLSFCRCDFCRGVFGAALDVAALDVDAFGGRGALQGRVWGRGGRRDACAASSRTGARPRLQCIIAT
jgi:hypothetical protein